jgi:hypothetical protein
MALLAGSSDGYKPHAEQNARDASVHDISGTFADAFLLERTGGIASRLANGNK